MEIGFGVQSEYASVYNAFIIECEKIGWKWNEGFNRKEDVNNYTEMFRGCIWLSNLFSRYVGEPAFSFSGCDETICLDTNFDDAVKKAKEYYAKIIDNKKKRLSMALTRDYNAIIDNDEIVVGSQHISFEKFDELALLVKKYRES